MPCLWSIGWHHLRVISAIFFFFYGHNNHPSNCLFVKRCYICWSDSQAKTTVFGTIIYAQQIYWFMMRFPRFFLTLRSLHIKVRALNNHYFVSSCKLFSQHLFRIEWWDLLFWSYNVDVNCIHWDHNIFKFCWMLNLHVVAIYWSPLPATDFTKLCQKCSSWWWWRTDLKVVGRQEAWSRDGLGVRAFALHQCGEFSASTLWVLLILSLLEGGIGLHKKPQNRTNNNRKLQNRNRFRSKPKTANKIREDVQVVRGAYFPKGNRKNTKLHRIANPKTWFYFCRKPRAK